MSDFRQKDLASPEFKALLEEKYTWPSEYMFKFIVPAEELNNLLDVLGLTNDDVELKQSGKGNYISVTIRHVSNSSDEIVEKYTIVSNIKGIISL